MESEPRTVLPPPSDKRMAWFEKTYRVSIGPDFAMILKHHNGATPLTNVFSQGASERLIERMLCLLECPSEDEVNGQYDITVVMSQLDARLISDKQLIGTNVIPIASLFGGDFLCLDYRKHKDSPVVSVWDHERSREFEPYLVEVSTSLRAFVLALRKS